MRAPRDDAPLDALSHPEQIDLCRELDALTVRDSAYARAACTLVGLQTQSALGPCERTRDACLGELESSCRDDDGSGMELNCPGATVGQLLDCVRDVAADFKQRYAELHCGASTAPSDVGMFGWPGTAAMQRPACRALAGSCPDLFIAPAPSQASDAGAGPGGDAAPARDDAEVDADPFLCGGAYRDPCAPDKYCAWSAGCGTAGNCLRRERTCSQGAPVCGCDGQTYASECAAGANGVGVAHAGACPAASVQFRCGDFVCDGASYCLDVRSNRRDPDQQGFVCVPLPPGCDSCACSEQLGKACYVGATCSSVDQHLNVVCK